MWFITSPAGRSLGRAGLLSLSVCVYLRTWAFAARCNEAACAPPPPRKYLLSRLKQKMQFHTWTERQVLRFIPLCSRRAAAPIELATSPVRISEHIISLSAAASRALLLSLGRFDRSAFDLFRIWCSNLIMHRQRKGRAALLYFLSKSNFHKMGKLLERPKKSRSCEFAS